MSKPFYITTTLPYVNAEPHIGFALEIILADVVARFHKALGDEVFFNTGTDEHGQKLYQKAVEAGLSPQEYVDGYAEKFRALIPRLGISSDIHFIRTTDEHHKRAAQEFWKLCEAAGDIYKKTYKVKYCVGCELEKTDSELVEGECPIHPGRPIEFLEEENYFFKFSKYQKELLELYEIQECHCEEVLGRSNLSEHQIDCRAPRTGLAMTGSFVVPASRQHEIREFVSAGLQDFSISRLKEKMPWGIPVPGDEEQVMYVWFDALINYISTLGWGNPIDELRVTSYELNSRNPQPATRNLFERFWGTKDTPNAVQIAGKDNLRQQSAMWQAMLLSAGLPTSKKIIIHGFITSNGQKMSKSIGNVVGPFEVIDALVQKGVAESQAVDALRYWVAREMNTFEDGDFTWEKFWESYNANLANGLGNLTSRILKMAGNAQIPASSFQVLAFDTEYKGYLENFEIQRAADWVWAKIKQLDEYIAKEEPFKVVKVDEKKGREQIMYLLGQLSIIAKHLSPLMPDTSEKITQALNGEIENPRLFPRI